MSKIRRLKHLILIRTGEDKYHVRSFSLVFSRNNYLFLTWNFAAEYGAGNFYAEIIVKQCNHQDTYGGIKGSKPDLQKHKTSQYSAQQK